MKEESATGEDVQEFLSIEELQSVGVR